MVTSWRIRSCCQITAHTKLMYSTYFQELEALKKENKEMKKDIKKMLKKLEKVEEKAKSADVGK